MGRWIRLSLVVLVLGGFTACSGSGDDSGGEAGDGGDEGTGVVRQVDAMGDSPLGAPDVTADSGAGGGKLGSATTLPGVEPSVIKNATLKIGVEDGRVDNSVSAATSLARRHGGFVLSSGISVTPSTGNVVIRVPSGSFEEALVDLKDLGEVRDQRVSGEDVSLEFVDLEARLRNFSVQETVMLRLMERSQTVADTIRVQRQLEDIQLEIEQIRGRLRFLKDQTSYGTIAMSISEIGAVPGSKPILQRAWEQATEAFLNVIGGVVVVAGSILPFLVIAALGLLIFRRVIPKSRLTRGEV